METTILYSLPLHVCISYQIYSKNRIALSWDGWGQLSLLPSVATVMYKILLLLSPYIVSSVSFFVPPSTIVGGEHYVFRLSVRSSVRRLSTSVSRDVVSLYLVNGFQRNLPQIFIMLSVHCWKGFQGQRSKVKVMTGR